MKNRFIFTTRYLGENKAFSQRKGLSNSSFIWKILVDHFSKHPDDIWDWFYSFYFPLTTISQGTVPFDSAFGYSSIFFGDQPKHKDVFMKFFSELPDEKKTEFFERLIESKALTPKIEQEITNCPGKDAPERMAARFSYFLLAQQLDNDVEAYAVPHLKWESDLGWIKALIEETFEKEQFQEGTIHLILHDHDLPGYENTPFRILTADEILSVFFSKPTGKDKQEHIREGVYYYNKGVQLRIVVFQHTWNDVTEILNKKCKILSVDFDSLGKNSDVVNEILGSSSSELDECFKDLSIDGSVDLCHSLIKDDVEKFKFDCDNQPYYIYEDNGALLTEFMHIKTDLASSKQTVRFIKMLRKPAFNEKGELSDIRKMKFPIIIVIKPFFENWAITVPDKSEQIEIHKNKLALESNLKQVFSFFNDSSIWIRLVKNENEKNRAIQEFTYFKRIGLYGYNSAWENLEYNTRHFSGNYLIPTTGGHGRFVTPLLFGNEIKALERMKGVFESDV